MRMRAVLRIAVLLIWLHAAHSFATNAIALVAVGVCCGLALFLIDLNFSDMDTFARQMIQKSQETKRPLYLLPPVGALLVLGVGTSMVMLGQAEPTGIGVIRLAGSGCIMLGVSWLLPSITGLLREFQRTE